MNKKKISGYVSVCGITIALNIVCIMMLSMTPLDAFACNAAIVFMTPAIAKFGWKRAFPIYVGTAVLGAVFMEPTLSLLYLCTGFQAFGADTDGCGGRRRYLKLLVHCVVMGSISSILLIVLAEVFGMTAVFRGDHIGIIIISMIVLAFCQGVIYRVAKNLLYRPILKPMLDNIMDD